MVVTQMGLWTSEEDISSTSQRELNVCNNEVQFALISLDLLENSWQQRWWWISIFPQYAQVTNSVPNPMDKGSGMGKTNIGNLWCHLVVNKSNDIYHVPPCSLMKDTTAQLFDATMIVKPASYFRL